MAFPGFTGSLTGFCTNARVIEYEEGDEQILVAGFVAAVSFRFTMVYERATYHERSTGRDVWIFERSDDRWITVWRTMVDLKEERHTKV
jgi:hypothetical protein